MDLIYKHLQIGLYKGSFRLKWKIATWRQVRAHIRLLALIMPLKTKIRLHFIHKDSFLPYREQCVSITKSSQIMLYIEAITVSVRTTGTASLHCRHKMQNFVKFKTPFFWDKTPCHIAEETSPEVHRCEILKLQVVVCTVTTKSLSL
jgi:hypothetical protein